MIQPLFRDYSHLSNNRGGWNKHGGGAKYAKSLNVEFGNNMEGGILWKKLMCNSNKRGVEGGKNLRNQFFCGGWNFSNSVSVDPTFIREMRVGQKSLKNIVGFLVKMMTSKSPFEIN